MNEVFSFYDQLYSGTGKMYSTIHNPLSDPEYVIEQFSMRGIPKRFLVIPTVKIVDNFCQINMVIPNTMKNNSAQELLEGILQDDKAKYTYKGAELPDKFILKLEPISSQDFYDFGVLIELKIIKWTPMLQLYVALRVSDVQKLCKTMSRDNIIHPLVCGNNHNMCDISIDLPPVYQEDSRLLDIILNSNSKVCANVSETVQKKKECKPSRFIYVFILILIIALILFVILWHRKIHILGQEV